MGCLSFHVGVRRSCVSVRSRSPLWRSPVTIGDLGASRGRSSGKYATCIVFFDVAIRFDISFRNDTPRRGKFLSKNALIKLQRPSRIMYSKRKPCVCRAKRREADRTKDYFFFSIRSASNPKCAENRRIDRSNPSFRDEERVFGQSAR